MVVTPVLSHGRGVHVSLDEEVEDCVAPVRVGLGCDDEMLLDVLVAAFAGEDDGWEFDPAHPDSTIKATSASIPIPRMSRP